MITLEEIPKTFYVTEDMAKAYADLEMITPFNLWLRTLAFEEIERIRQERKEATP